MNRKLKLVLVNILVLILLLVNLDLYAYKKCLAECNKYVQNQIQEGNSIIDKNYAQKQVKYGKTVFYNYEKKVSSTLPRVYKGTKARPIVTIGCSFTDGAFLDKNQTFAYKLNKLTNRTTYNRGIGSTGPQWVYRQLSDKNFKKEIPDAEYVIYTFIINHIERMFKSSVNPWHNYVDLNYRLKNGKLVERKEFWQHFRSSFLVRKYLVTKEHFEYESECKKNLPLFLKIMQESVNTTHKLYPNSKFVLIDVPETYYTDEDFEKNKMPEPVVSELEKMGIIYIDAEDLVGHKFRNIDKYHVGDKRHPNELFWDELTPALVKKLNL